MSPLDLVIGLDLGTTNPKAVALDPHGAVIVKASSDYRLLSPHSGWAEQDGPEVWQGVCACLLDLGRQIAGRPSMGQAAALCLSGAMHGVLLSDANGEPLAPAPTWADQRAAPQAAALRAHTGLAELHELYLRTGCPLQSIYHIPKMRWWREEHPHLAAQAAHYSTIKDWILFKLTGRWAIDLGMASTTGLLDIHSLKWDAQALELAGVQPGLLPDLVSPRAVVGGLTAEAARLTGLPEGLPVIAGGSDGALANLGSGAARPGESVITVGTSGAVRRVVGSPLLDNAERTWCYILSEQRWFAGGAINNGGLALQWVREQFYSDVPGADGFTRLMRDAASIPPGAGGVMMLPYFAGERSPHWDPQARAVITNLGLEHNRAHVARAVLEAVAFALADVWEALQEAPLAPTPTRLTGGVTRSPAWAQIIADVIGAPLSLNEAADASAVGAAMLGQWGLGMVPSLEAPAERITAGHRLDPDPERHKFYQGLHRRFQELYKKLMAHSS